MGFYANFIIPRCLNLVMSNPVLAEYRQQLLKDVSGEILEIGFGTGLNLPYYPPKVKQITTIDPNPGMNKFAQAQIANSSIKVHHQVVNGEHIPLDDQSYDFIICTWTLCSIPNVDQALAEIHRLLKPGGKFLFIEHGISPDHSVQLWQNYLNPLQKIIADGCHLNRNIKGIVSQKFSEMKIEQFYAPNLPKIIAYMYQGLAIK